MSQDVAGVDLLVPEDLPAGWRMPDPTPIDPETDSATIDAVLKYEKWVDPEPGLDRNLRSGHNDGRDGRWFLIQHV